MNIRNATASILLAGIAMGLAACTPGGGGAGGSVDGNVGRGPGTGPVELGHYEDAIRVTPTLDSDQAVTRVIDFAGGTLSATAADGTVFTLTIPADSLRQVTRITMTPVAKLDGLPFGDGTDVTVDLQPSGLVFDVPATLTIAPATPIPPGEQILYGYSDGLLTFAEPVLKADGIGIVLEHFSGYGAAKGFMGDVEEARRRIGGSAEERIASEMRAVMQEARQAGFRGEPVNLNALLDPYFEQMKREVLDPRVAAAGQSCAAGRSAVTFLLSYGRQRDLLGYPDGGEFNRAVRLLEDTVAGKCMDEEYEMCVEKHFVHRIGVAYMANVRQMELLGIEAPALEAKMKRQVEGCLHFDLEFKVDTRFEMKMPPPFANYMSYAESTELSTEVAFSMDRTLANAGATYFEPSSGPMEPLKQVYRQTAPGCVQGTVSRWSDTGHFLAMDLDGEPADLDKGGGGVTTIEVELGLPSPLVTISGLTCGGVTAPPAADLIGAPHAYLVNHGDGFIRDWTIHGGEIFATAEWSIMNQMSPAATNEDVGTATLRHTPQTVH